jgi:hypothetical protein
MFVNWSDRDQLCRWLSIDTQLYGSLKGGQIIILSLECAVLDMSFELK